MKPDIDRHKNILLILKNKEQDPFKKLTKSDIEYIIYNVTTADSDELFNNIQFLFRKTNRKDFEPLARKCFDHPKKFKDHDMLATIGAYIDYCDGLDGK